VAKTPAWERWRKFCAAATDHGAELHGHRVYCSAGHIAKHVQFVESGTIRYRSKIRLNAFAVDISAGLTPSAEACAPPALSANLICCECGRVPGSITKFAQSGRHRGQHRIIEDSVRCYVVERNQYFAG